MGRIVHVDVSDHIAIMRLAAPPLNLLSTAMRRALEEEMLSVAQKEDVRAVVLRGEGGKAFSAGSDMNEFLSGSGGVKERLERAAAEHRLLSVIERVPQPTIAAVHGYTLGGGLEIALACDLRVGDTTTVLGFPEVRVGMFPSGGGLLRLMELLPRNQVARLAWLGEPVTPQEAFNKGLLDVVDDRGDAVEAALGLARHLAELPALAIRAIKRVIRTELAQGAQCAEEVEEEQIAELHASDDAREGLSAFLEKRAPVFRHR